MSEHVGVVGLGYVGLPLAVALTAAGHSVVGYEVDAGLASRLSEGDSHVVDVPASELSAALRAGMVVTSSAADLVGCSVFIICVPTPLTPGGQPDTGYIASAVSAIRPYVTPGALVVLESTSYPGTTEEIVQPLLEADGRLHVGSEVCLAFSPERVDPGNASFGLANTPKIVAGLEPCCRSRAAALYSSVCTSVVEASGLREAELAKLLENTYRQVNIALMNEMVKFCRALDIDLYESIRLASTKPFGFQPFYPGPGVGGHCIPIDPKYLASRVQSELGYAFRFVELAQEINEGMPAYVVSRLDSELALRGGWLKDARVLLLGVTYKADVADTRVSPAEEVVRHLRAAGASVAYLDPFVPAWAVDEVAVDRVPADRSDFDAAIYLQDHSEFATLDLSTFAPLLLDTRGRLTGSHVIGL